MATKFNVDRGWPMGGAIEDVWTPASGAVFHQGHFTKLSSTGTASALADSDAVDDVATGAVAPSIFGLVIEGNVDSNGEARFSGAYVGKVVVLLSGYEATIPALDPEGAALYEDNGAAFAAGDAFTVINGIATKWSNGDADYRGFQVVGQVTGIGSDFIRVLVK